MTVRRFLFASLICMPLTACLAEEPEETEELSTTESDLCTDGAADAVVAFQDTGGFSGATSAQPTSSYDRAACSDRYTVEVTGVSQATQPFNITGGWGESLPNTQQTCELAFANVQAQEYRVTSWNCSGQFCLPVYSWQNVGAEVSLHGQWTPFFDSYFCQLVPSSPLPTLQPSVWRSKVRVAVRAYAWALLFPAYKRGEAGVYSQEIIY